MLQTSLIFLMGLAFPNVLVSITLTNTYFTKDGAISPARDYTFFGSRIFTDLDTVSVHKHAKNKNLTNIQPS